MMAELEVDHTNLPRVEEGERTPPQGPRPAGVQGHHHRLMKCVLLPAVSEKDSLPTGLLILSVSVVDVKEKQTLCQCFAVLEDGALAHNLQEQEIEQYYSTNIQKNQLVQNDIRVAKRLQDEEEEQWAQESALQRQASKQLEEQDFEYARLVQEEILRCAEEAQRREQDDE
ncbi:unnamed protein product, partial [Tetraodon nigroviridis]